MTSATKTKTEHEVIRKNLMKEIRQKMEQVDELKKKILMHEHELYTLYSKLDDLDSEVVPLYMQKCMTLPDIGEHICNENGHVKQAG